MWVGGKCGCDCHVVTGAAQLKARVCASDVFLCLLR